MIFLYEFFMVVLLKKVNIEFVVEKNFSIVFGVKVFGDYLVNCLLFCVFGDGQIDFIFDEYWEVVIDVRNFYYDGGIVVFFWVFEITNIG